MGYAQTKNLDGNALDAVTVPLDIFAENTCAVQVTIETGSISSFVLTLEGSNDTVKWYTMGTTVATESISAATSCTQYRFARGRVSTANGAALLLTVTIISKLIP